MAVEKSPIEWALAPIKKYAQFSGRAPRAEYWWYTLGVIIAEIVTMMIDGIIGIDVFGPYGVLTSLLIVGLIVPGLAVTIRRLHDTNRSGWWICAPLVPYIIALVMMGPALLNPQSGAAMPSLGLAGILMLAAGVMGIVFSYFLCCAEPRGPTILAPTLMARTSSRCSPELYLAGALTIV